MSAGKYGLKEPSAPLTRLAVWPRVNARAEHQVAEGVDSALWRLLIEIRGWGAYCPNRRSVDRCGATV
jgi:hypothetical protein